MKFFQTINLHNNKGAKLKVRNDFGHLEFVVDENNRPVLFRDSYMAERAGKAIFAFRSKRLGTC